MPPAWSVGNFTKSLCDMVSKQPKIERSSLTSIVLFTSILTSFPLQNKIKDDNNKRDTAREKGGHTLETFFVKGQD